MGWTLNAEVSFPTVSAMGEGKMDALGGGFVIYSRNLL